MDYKIGIAHQKVIRDKKSETDSQNLFGRYWDGLNLDLKNGIVKPISVSCAKKMIEEYEWLGCMPAISWYCFGLFFDGYMAGCVVFSPEYSENLGLWDKYDYTGKMILLSRGVCLHWAPKNANSMLIMSAIRMLPDKFKIVTATTDHLAGEVGTIYQACNFHYVGSMRETNPNVKSRPIDREGWIIRGKLYGSRAVRAKYGDQKMETLLKYNKDVVRVKQMSKHRYFLYRGSKKEISYYRSTMQDRFLPYPKRFID